MENNVIIILGMGRSGTSFVANWLQVCGLNLGNKFLKPNFMNVKGFFEDTEVLKFQEHILQKNGVESIFTIKQNKHLCVTEKDCKEAKSIIDKKNEQFSQWGWKDPRTNLFTKTLWNDVLPNAKIIVVYRPYWQVVDSIYRADINNQLRRRNKILGSFKLLIHFLGVDIHKKANIYLEAWIRHNQDILSFIEQKKVGDVCVINVENLIKNSDSIFKILTDKLSISLQYEDPNSIFDEDLFKKVNNDKFKFSQELSLKAEYILKELEKYSKGK